MRNALEHTAPTPSERRTDTWLWTSFLLSPLAMGVNTIAGFTVAHWTSDTGRKHFSYLVSAIDFVLCLCALGIAGSLRRKFEQAEDDVPVEGRRLFWAKVSVWLAILALLLVIAQTLAVVTLHPFD